MTVVYVILLITLPNQFHIQNGDLIIQFMLFRCAFLELRLSFLLSVYNIFNGEKKFWDQ
jgi:hypothetical protein